MSTSPIIGISIPTLPYRGEYRAGCSWNGPQEVLCDRVAALQRFFLTHDRTSVYAIDGTAVDEVVLHPVGFLAATAQGALARCIRPSPTRSIMPVNGCACCGIRRCEPARVVTMTISFYAFAMLALSGKYRYE